MGNFTVRVKRALSKLSTLFSEVVSKLGDEYGAGIPDEVQVSAVAELLDPIDVLVDHLNRYLQESLLAGAKEEETQNRAGKVRSATRPTGLELWLRRIRKDAPQVPEVLYMPFALIVETCVRECRKVGFRDPEMQDTYELALRNIAQIVQDLESRSGR